jgi:hypothetical protein
MGLNASLCQQGLGERKVAVYKLSTRFHQPDKGALGPGMDADAYPITGRQKK